MIDRQDVISLLSDLVRIPSVNPRMGGGAGEEAIARFLAERLRALGLTPTITEVHPGRPAGEHRSGEHGEAVSHKQHRGHVLDSRARHGASEMCRTADRGGR